MHNSTLFSKILNLIPRCSFSKIVKKYEGNKWVKSYSSWDQLVSILYGQITG